MTQVVKLRLDLGTTVGRAAMRAYLDALDGAVGVAGRPQASRGNGGETASVEPEFGDIEREDPGPILIKPEGTPAAQTTAVRGGVTAPVSTDHANGTDDRASGERAQVEVLPNSADQMEGELSSADVAEFHEIAAEIDAALAVDAAAAPVESRVEVLADRPVAVAPEAMGGGEALDPERPWTDALRLEVWRLREVGMRQADIARRLELRPARVHMLVADWKRGKRLPPAGAGGGSTALVVAAPAGAVTLRPDGGRMPAQDPAIVDAWREQCAEGERLSFVRRALYHESGS